MEIAVIEKEDFVRIEAKLDAILDYIEKENQKPLTVSEWAAANGVTRATVYAWIREGQLETVDCPGTIRIAPGQDGKR